MKKLGALTLATAAIVLLTGAKDVRGSVWRNPSNSVHVRFDACGPNLCGKVVWANDKAKADAARGTGGNLVGTAIFRDLHPSGPNQWQGQVFVPDLGVSFSGTVTRRGNDQLVGEGCLIANVGCRQQVWTRVSG
jgi:uncharacterized protein (DUF2147 family)